MFKIKIGEVLREIITRLLGVRRWQNYPNKSYEENVAGHSLEMALLVINMIAIEEHSGRKKFDKFRILSSAILHDLTEIILTDIPWDIKNDSRIKDGLIGIEKEKFAEILKKFPEEARLTISAAHNLQYEEDSFEDKFWSGAEQLGYIMYAWEEYEKGNTSFIKVFNNQHAGIMSLAPEVKSLAILYRPYLREILPLIKGGLTREEIERAEKFLKEG